MCPIGTYSEWFRSEIWPWWMWPSFPPGTFTHINNRCLTQSWLDLVVHMPGFCNVMTGCDVLHNVSYDRFPLLIQLNLEQIPTLHPQRQDSIHKTKYNSSNASKSEEYGELPHLTRTCMMLQGAVLESWAEGLYRGGVFGSTRKQWQQVPGWNKFVQDVHHVARDAILEWCPCGSPQ